MAYEPKTENLDLGDGQYAVFFQELKHGTQKKVNALTRPFLKYPDGKPPKLTLQEGDDPKPVIEGATKVEVDLDEIDFEAVNDAIILGQVQDWSFGPVDQGTLDGLPERIRGLLKNECDRLYGTQGTTGPLPNSGGGN